MLDYIRPHIKSSSPRIINKWTEYKQALMTQVEYLKNRYINGPGYESKGVQLLRNILSFIDMNYLNKQSNDFDRYVKYLQYIQTDLVNIFDPSSVGKSKTNVFIAKTQYDVDEYLVPVKAVNVFTEYPFDKKWNNGWESIKPVRLVDHDSNELTLFMLNDQVRFKKVPPMMATITIDPTMLALQYYNYIKYCKDKEKGQREFIHKYVLDSFFEDLVNIWLLKQISQIAQIDDDNILIKLNKNDIIADQMYGYVGSRYNEAIIALHNEFKNVRNGTTRPETIIRSDLLINSSIMDRIKLFTNVLDVENSRQMFFLEFIRDRALTDLITRIFLLYPDYSESKNLILKLKYQYERVNSARIWNNINDPIIRLIVQTEITELRRKISLY